MDGLSIDLPDPFARMRMTQAISKGWNVDRVVHLRRRCRVQFAHHKRAFQRLLAKIR
jgi:hypothetical protein